jgi:hypothetical protein
MTTFACPHCGEAITVERDGSGNHYAVKTLPSATPVADRPSGANVLSWRSATVLCFDCEKPIDGPIHYRKERIRAHAWPQFAKRALCRRCLEERHASCWCRKQPFDGTRTAIDCWFREMRERQCRWCRRWLIYEGHPVHYCGDGCRKAAAAERRSDARAVKLTRTCSVCGTRYQAKRVDSAYCSPACRQKAFRQRKVERERG